MLKFDYLVQLEVAACQQYVSPLTLRIKTFPTFISQIKKMIGLSLISNKVLRIYK
jgi:hypothetical protein